MIKRNVLRLTPFVLAAALMLAMVPAAFAEEQGTTDGETTEETAAATQELKNNTAPIAQNLNYTTYKNIAFEGMFSATDADGDAMEYRLVEKPARGAVTLADDGSAGFVYTPYENKTGKDSFSYVAVDVNGNISAAATVSVKIEKNKAKMTYADMDGNAAHYAALRLAEAGIFQGETLNGDYFFHPDAEVTRSEFVAMAMQAANFAPIEGVTRTGFYDDDAIEAWAKPYIASGVKAGVVRGSSNENGQLVFYGNSTITYAEASVLLNRMLGITDVSNVSVETMTATNYVPLWAYQAAANLSSVNMLDLTQTNLNDILTRAEAAELLLAALDFRA